MHIYCIIQSEDFLKVYVKPYLSSFFNSIKELIEMRKCKCKYYNHDTKRFESCWASQTSWKKTSMIILQRFHKIVDDGG